MTLFNPEILSIEEDILYHEQQLKEAQERLDQVKLSQVYSDTVISSLEDFFENTDPFLYEVLKGHVDQMFKENKVTYNNDFEEKEPASICASTDVGSSDEIAAVFNPPQPDIPHTVEEDEQPSIVKLSDNVIYDQDTDCIHIGFRLSSDGYAWREELVYKQKFSTKSWFEESEHLEDYPKELIIEGITLDQARQLVETCDFSKPPAKQPVEVREELYEKPHYPNPKIPIKLADYTPGQTPVNKVEIAPGIIYIPVDKTAFVAMRAKGRARTYGDMLTRVLDIGSNTNSLKKCYKY